MKKIGVAIIGAGLIGNKRAAIIQKIGLGKILVVADSDLDKARVFGEKYSCVFFSDYKKAIEFPDVEVVIVAVPNVFIFPIAMYALRNKKHILCEKPFGVNAREAKLMLNAAKGNKCLIKVGFNHRFHATILKAKEMFDKGKIGKLLFIRSRYGHGGRPGIEKEWRSNKSFSGGGELLDQGVHIIDLCRWFGGPITEVFGRVETKFWPIRVEDNAFVTMRGKSDAIFQFHVSWTNWKNIFSFEIFGSKGFLDIDGRGGSYGRERLIFGMRPSKGGVPKIRQFEWNEDASWEKEWRNFYNALMSEGHLVGDGKDGIEANKVIEAIYKSSQSGKVVKI